MKFTKYDRLGAYHWDEYSEGTVYADHVDFLMGVMRTRSGDQILDVGAGDGLITSVLSKFSEEVFGIDDEPEAVRLAVEKGARVSLGDAYSIPAPDCSFEIVLMSDVVEHLEQPSLAIEEARRLLVPGGALWVVTPPRVEGQPPRKFHYKEYTPKELESFVTGLGFRWESTVQKPDFVRFYSKFVKSS